MSNYIINLNINSKTRYKNNRNITYLLIFIYFSLTLILNNLSISTKENNSHL